MRLEFTFLDFSYDTLGPLGRRRGGGFDQDPLHRPAHDATAIVERRYGDVVFVVPRHPVGL